MFVLGLGVAGNLLTSVSISASTLQFLAQISTVFAKRALPLFLPQFLKNLYVTSLRTH